MRLRPGFNAALKSGNNTSNAIVSRSKVLPDRLDGTPLGDPANIVLSEDHRTAYVVNHLGAVNNAEFLMLRRKFSKGEHSGGQ